ncbi:ATP-binding protein [Luteimonas sp. FXH3W]|uniref:ATP-binding protein n=1 Tax=Aquilutibacter rugosus TaxID=3115820 RepID=A0ABU7UWN6_9GAMM
MTNRDIDLIDELRRLPAETAWMEFKRDNAEPNGIGKRCSALSNAARFESQDCAYMLWGIDDATHEVVGTSFEPDAEKISGQPLSLWLANCLQPSLAFEFRSVAHPNGRVVLLEVPAATGSPVSFNNIAYIRIGSATPKLADYPERHQKLIERMRPYRWEQDTAMRYVTGDDVLRRLDYSQYFRLTDQPLPDNRAGIFDKLAAERAIVSDVGGRWSITNLGAILLANNLDEFPIHIARKAVRFVAYAGSTRAQPVTHRLDMKKGYAVGFETLIESINGLLPRNEHIGSALRESHPLFPELAIRELVANALIHQDMTIAGAGPQIELFDQRLEIGNPGQPLIKPERMVDLPPRSRNEALASLMRRMNICEEQGSGLDKVIQLVEVFQLPAPWLRAEESSMQVILYGPRKFAEMSPDERVRACYFHAVLKALRGDRMKNASLCARFGIDPKNAAMATAVINKTLDAGLIRHADPEHLRAGYVPIWA